MARRPPEFDLTSAIADTGFTPALSDTPALLDLLAARSAALRERAERALRRIGLPILGPAMARAADTSDPEVRARLVAVVGRVGGAAGDATVAAFLRGALGDREAAVRRRAAAGLGRTVGDAGELEALLIAALGRETDLPARNAMVEALGRVGGAAAHATLAAMGSAGDLKTAAELRKARVRAARPAARSEGSMVDMAHPLGAPTTIWLDARRGMLPVLLEEAAAFHPRIAHRLDGSAVAAIEHTGSLDALFAVRTWLSLSLPCPPVKREAHGDALAAAAARALASGPARPAATALTRGPLRYRIAWAGGGKRRAMTYRVAESAAVLDPALINDPTDAVWQVVLHETADRVAAEWIPTLDDPRFAYRSGDVPAASHPTVAAALAYLAGVQPDDVVWDPFVGSGLELCERALRGPYARLVGTDLEAAALDVARANLTAGGAERFDLLVHDAERGAPAGLRPTLVITNPPMGRRVHRSGDLRDVLARFITRVGRALAPHGRFVWVNPFPADMRGPAERAGLTYRRGHVIDMGGFDAEIQVWEK